MKKIYLKPETSVHVIKTESLLTTMSMSGETSIQLSKQSDLLWDFDDDEEY